MRILIADDDRTSRIILRKFLGEFGHEVEEADDGLKALAFLRDNVVEIDLLVLDIMMPEMDGLTLLELIRRRYPLLPVIMLTSKGDRGFVKRALKLGASDFLDKPVKRDALRSAIREAVGNVSQKKLADSLETSMAVREVQAQLLDNSACDECGFTDSINFWFRPYSDAGGDFFLCRSGDRFCQVVLADVAGHDVKSSYAVAELRGILEGLGRMFEDPGELLKAINRVFVTRSGASDTFVCALCFFVDFERGEWRIANAGVPYPFIHRTSGASHWLRISGNMLGVLSAPSFETAVLRMAPGDTVLAFSDGLEEVLSHADVVESWSKVVDADSLRQRLDGFVQKNSLPSVELKDDILLLSLKQPCLDELDNRVPDLDLCLEMPGSLDEVEVMSGRLNELVHVYFDAMLEDDLASGFAGLLKNAVVHGNEGRRRSVVRVFVTVDASSRRFVVKVADEGRGFSLAEALAEAPNGSLATLNKRCSSLVVEEGTVVAVLEF